MNTIKKIGLTALAGSLVATSVFAGEMTVTGSAGFGGKLKKRLLTGKAWSMGNSVTFTGGGELDNGFTVDCCF